MEYVEKLDRYLFLLLNGHHSPWSDKIWLTITAIPTWIPLYAALILWIVVYFKKDSIWIITGAILMVVFTDQFTSSFMKPYFGRLRPCHDPDLAPLVHLAKSCGGLFGFASGHAANSFGIAMYIWLAFRYRFRWSSLLFLWATIVALSRVMIGVHYPFDIIAGAATGVLIAWVVFRLTESLFFYFRMEPLIKD